MYAFAVTQHRRLSGSDNRKLLLTVLKAGMPRSRYHQVWFLLRHLSMAGRWPRSLCGLSSGYYTLVSLGGFKFPLLIRTLVRLD